MGVSKNHGTPKSSILIGFSIINHPFWGIPIFGNTHIYIYIYTQTILAHIPIYPCNRQVMPQFFKKVNESHFQVDPSALGSHWKLVSLPMFYNFCIGFGSICCNRAEIRVFHHISWALEATVTSGLVGGMLTFREFSLNFQTWSILRILRWRLVWGGYSYVF